MRMPIYPAVEIGWRLAFEAWGFGYGQEAALAVLKAGFEKYGLSEIIAITVPKNRRSIHLMEKIGMGHELDKDFDHPLVPVGHPLRPHVLYRIKAAT